MQTFHSLVGLFYITVLFAASMISAHPLLTGGVFLLTLLALAEAGALEKGERILQYGIWMCLFIMILNPLLIRAGETILWAGPELPLAGTIQISMEAVCYGAAMGVRLMTLMLIACLGQVMIHSDRLLGQFARFAGKPLLMLAIAVRLFPLIERDFAEAREVQEMRGIDFNAGGLSVRVAKYAWIYRAVLVSVLEGSFQTAEAMQARAFGSGPRSSYRRDYWRPRDLICLLAASLALLLLVYAQIKGCYDFSYYPRLGSLGEHDASLIWPGLILTTLAVPLMLGRAWNGSVFIRSKI